MCHIRLNTCKIVLITVTFGILLTEALDVNFTGSWHKAIGWELVCSWSFQDGDYLHSTKLYRGNKDQELFSYKPKSGVTRFYNSFDNADETNDGFFCREQEKYKGFCILRVEPKKPPKSDILYMCEVSGEAPRFRISDKSFTIKAFVPCVNAQIQAMQEADDLLHRVSLNCTASGIPAPDLVWTIDGQKVPAAFTSRSWNSQLKLGESWSTISVAPVAASTVLAICTPEQYSSADSIIAAEYLISSSSITYGTTNYGILFLVFLLFLR